jgi:hypothetical protein
MLHVNALTASEVRRSVSSFMLRLLHRIMNLRPLAGKHYVLLAMQTISVIVLQRSAGRRRCNSFGTEPVPHVSVEVPDTVPSAAAGRTLRQIQRLVCENRDGMGKWGAMLGRPFKAVVNPALLRKLPSSLSSCHFNCFSAQCVSRPVEQPAHVSHRAPLPSLALPYLTFTLPDGPHLPGGGARAVACGSCHSQLPERRDGGATCLRWW